MRRVQRKRWGGLRVNNRTRQPCVHRRCRCVLFCSMNLVLQHPVSCLCGSEVFLGLRRSGSAPSQRPSQHPHFPLNETKFFLLSSQKSAVDLIQFDSPHMSCWKWKIVAEGGSFPRMNSSILVLTRCAKCAALSIAKAFVRIWGCHKLPYESLSR